MNGTSVKGSAYHERYALEVASDATGDEQCPCKVQPMCDKSVETGAGFLTDPRIVNDVFVYSRAMNGKPDVDVHKTHFRQVLQLIRKHKLYANLKNCINAASKIPLLGCFVGKHSVRPNSQKIRSITIWPVSVDVKELRKFFGLATNFSKYTQHFVEKKRLSFLFI